MTLLLVPGSGPPSRGSDARSTVGFSSGFSHEEEGATSCYTPVVL
jgi:hypothetical protein